MVATLAPCLISTGPSDASRPHQPRESESDGAVEQPEQRHYASSAAIRAHGSRSERTIRGGRPRSSSHSSLGPLIIPRPDLPRAPSSLRYSASLFRSAVTAANHSRTRTPVRGGCWENRRVEKRAHPFVIPRRDRGEGAGDWTWSTGTHLTGEWSDDKRSFSRETAHGCRLVAPALSGLTGYRAEMSFQCLCEGVWCILEQRRHFKNAESKDTGPCLVNVCSPSPKRTHRLSTAVFVELI